MRKKHSLQVCIKIYWRFVCYEEDEGEAKGTKERKKRGERHTERKSPGSQPSPAAISKRNRRVDG